MPKWTLALVALAISCQFSLVRGQCTAPPAILKGKKFFNSVTGEYIPIKGIDYYPRPNAGEYASGASRDFYSAEYENVWSRDIVEFQALGINVVRIYAVDPGLDHSGFMCALKSAGIYLMVGLAAQCEDCAITKDSAPTCYSAALKTRGEYIIKVFSKYDNVIAFDAGNEINHVVSADTPEINAPCQKQFVRDMRAYIKSCPTMRQIPVGVVMADTSRSLNALYYNCRSDPNDELENAEWYGLNVYLHCNGAAQSISELTAWLELQTLVQSLQMSIPFMLTEFGCLNESFETIDGYEAQRNWLQVDALFSESYMADFAGGFVFEYSTEEVFSNSQDDAVASPWPFTTYGPGNYGVGYFEPEFCDDVDIPCNYVRFPQFDTLASAYNRVDVSGQPSMDAYVPSITQVTSCPAQFPALSTFTWPSASVTSESCPGQNYVYVCPNESCPARDSATSAPTTSDGISAPTAAPTAAQTTTPAPTQEGMTSAPTATETGSPTAAPTVEMDAPVGPTSRPSSRPSDSPTQTPRAFGDNPTITLAQDQFSGSVIPSAALWSALCLVVGLFLQI